jgi:23S rRNA pseudouridine1911/1915/1917 synthase
VISFAVSAAEAGRRADVVLASHAGCTRTLAQRALRSGAVTVQETTVRPSHRVQEGEIVQGDVGRPTLDPPGPEDIPLDIRYEDSRVLVVSKPAGLVTHPAAGHTGGTLVNALLGLGVPLARRSSTRPGIIHRLDKGTSGLLLVAKDDQAQDALVQALRQRKVGRHYLALVRGRLPAPTGTLEAPVARHPTRRRIMAVVPEGRQAVTHYRTLASHGSVSLLDVSLETGRTHQIRVHMSHFGHPVIGDTTYGGGGEEAAALGLSRPFLHAHRLVFPHPDDGRPVEVNDPLPEGLTAALEAAGIDPPIVHR